MSNVFKMAAPLKTGRVVITGGCGNLGIKLARRLAAAGREVHILEQPGWLFADRLERGWRATECDLRESGLCAATGAGGAWAAELEGAAAVVHLAAQNPYPAATWDDAAASISMTANVVAAATAATVPRVVFTSSNHVMGGYKDDGSGVAGVGEAPIAPHTPTSVGTRWYADGAEHDSTPYATAKMAGERIVRSAAQEQAAAAAGMPGFGGTSFVCVRVGWCQPGENTPLTMNAAGVPPEHCAGAADAVVDPRQVVGDTHSDPELLERWYRSMWLSNPDFVQLMMAAVDAKDIGFHLLVRQSTALTVAAHSVGRAPTPYPPAPRAHNSPMLYCPLALLPSPQVNGNSDNTGMRWTKDGWDVLGYKPKDDSYAPKWLQL